MLRQAIVACRKGGTVSVPGVYTGFVDKMPMGAFMNKGLTMKTGQTHVHRYLQTVTRSRSKRRYRSIVRDYPSSAARSSPARLRNFQA